ncbi:MAG TPA: YbaB/EbfC family nucleoid-associated protein [Candidatus Saccharimonadales bacterium]|nr:YbaB/EbfC family nucleoid-associated protein [Candidatus Saccharimonadales bacterium]HSX49265.1 YbaB/EbfC family nucleoid-associated protein [Candidatus Saccharimonadales bacterium]
MNAFGKVGQMGELLKMRSEAMKVQKKLKEVTATVQKGKYSVKATGDQKVEFLSIDDEPQPELVKTINEALDKAQKEGAKKMLEEGGLSSLLKGF